MMGPRLSLPIASWTPLCTAPCPGSAEGGNRTIGLPGSKVTPCARDMAEPEGDIIPSREASRAKEDLLLIATLGE